MLPLIPVPDRASLIILPVAEIDVDAGMPLPLTDPSGVDIRPICVDMLPFVVCTFPTPTIAPCVDMLLFAVITHVSTYVPPEYADVANAFVMFNLESVHTVL